MNELLSKLKSRKLIVGTIAAAGVFLSEVFGLNLSQESLLAFASITAAYILGEASIDKQKVREDVQLHVASLEAQLQMLVEYLNSVKAGKPDSE